MIMKYASFKDIRELSLTPKDSKAVSVFIPTHRISTSENLRADRLRIKNAMQDIKATLKEEKIDKSEIKEYLKHLKEMYSDLEFWKYRDNGVAIYVKKDGITYYDLPIEIDFSVHIGSEFIISPLLASNEQKFRYHVLELNTNEPKYYLASQSGMERALLDTLPSEIKTALRLDEYQQQLQHGTSKGGGKDAMHHGHGGSDNKEVDVVNYIRLINKKLNESALSKSSMPLLLVGDPNLVGIYRTLSNYRNIYTESLEGNYEHVTDNELHAKTWEIMSKYFEAQEKIFASIFDKARNRDNTQTLITGERIRKAAMKGNIAVLTISIIHQTYDSVVRRMEKRYKIELPSDKRHLYNIETASREVMKTGGKITSMFYSSNEGHDSYIKAITR